ncbi:LANO_0A01926g1_1 [Lachancea nothofagi CBS 11611]|uniref:LANO_0A01926g1_1 n=1 Tax=Lachancea nothofagi CBS 11611 TaxID=1266666 RepID=A0A1G4IMX7_9SACH|nr:LANO_0A01926g1_1 [Lachancea nothofagi CBS 11611]
MLRLTSLRSYSALSKRTNKVKVQLLKDFPQFQLYKGQVASVSPSLMRNYLHWGNGARYIKEETDIDALLQAKSVEAATLRTKIAVKSVKKDDVAKEKPLREQSIQDDAKEVEEKIFSSGVTLKDVKIPGLEI